MKHCLNKCDAPDNLDELNGANFTDGTDNLLLCLKKEILMRKELIVKSEFWKYTEKRLKDKIVDEWGYQNSHSESKTVPSDSFFNGNIALFVIGLGSLEEKKESNFASMLQLAATLALNDCINIESIYFCDPAFTFVDNYLIFELFMEYNIHIEVFTGNDLSIPLNIVANQFKDKICGRDRKVNFLFFMPHCDRCVFGMLLHYFIFGGGKDLYINDKNAKIIVWGNNLDTFRIDSHKNLNKNCDYCNLLSMILEMNCLKTEISDSKYNCAFGYSFSDLTIYDIPIGMIIESK